MRHQRLRTHTHTHTHTHTRARTHARTHAHTHTHIRTLTNLPISMASRRALRRPRSSIAATTRAFTSGVATVLRRFRFGSSIRPVLLILRLRLQIKEMTLYRFHL